MEWTDEEIKDIKDIETEYRNFMNCWGKRLKYISANDVLFMLYRLGRLCEKTINSRFKKVKLYLDVITPVNIYKISCLNAKLCDCHGEYYKRLTKWFFNYDFYYVTSIDELKCNYCKRELEWEEVTIDHIIPIVKNGLEFDPTNLQILCRSCNSKKGAKISDKWGNSGYRIASLDKFVEV